MLCDSTNLDNSSSLTVYRGPSTGVMEYETKSTAYKQYKKES
jgi:hypothetical protein